MARPSCGGRHRTSTFGKQPFRPGASRLVHTQGRQSRTSAETGRGQHPAGDAVRAIPPGPLSEVPPPSSGPGPYHQEVDPEVGTRPRRSPVGADRTARVRFLGVGGITGVRAGLLHSIAVEPGPDPREFLFGGKVPPDVLGRLVHEETANPAGARKGCGPRGFDCVVAVQSSAQFAGFRCVRRTVRADIPQAAVVHRFPPQRSPRCLPWWPERS